MNPDAPEAAMTSERFSELLHAMPLPVTVVTVGRGGVENALTVSWASPVSFDPPEIMIAVNIHHYSVDFLRSTKNFAVNVLRVGQQRLAAHFARQSMTGEDKLEAIPHRAGETGAAILTDALAWFDCEVSALHEVGDHLLVVGTVVDGGVLNDGEPLVQRGRYRPPAPRR
jgi:flavin reductase (DIM6/NTAB) family NADH-FMN oxidoreductase RutF